MPQPMRYPLGQPDVAGCPLSKCPKYITKDLWKQTCLAMGYPLDSFVVPSLYVQIVEQACDRVFHNIYTTYVYGVNETES